MGPCHECEGECVNLYKKLNGKPVIPGGLLHPETPETGLTVSGESWRKMFDWLDEQKPKPVVFVGFESETKLTKYQVYGSVLSG